jgi:radical SAM protein with 4Fe4S-binding SPASM domain
MASVERARAHGLSVGCICTFTAQSTPHAGEIFDFFVREGLNFSLHAALPALCPHPNPPPLAGEGVRANAWSLSPQAHGQLLVDMLDRYLANLDKIHISTLDSMCRSVSAGQGGICTFGDCLGGYLAIDPQGWIYACQRLAELPEFRLGNVHACPTPETLAAAPAWRMFQNRQDRITEECGDCAHLAFCRGGCPYNALTANGGRFDGAGALRDPHCPAYQRTFSAIADRALAEVFSDENLDAIVTHGPGKHGLLRKGKLLHIMRGGPHPQETARQARKIVAAVALAAGGSPAEAVRRLERAGLITDRERALGSLTALQGDLRRQPQGLVNAYLHVTYTCNLACDHCYAHASPKGRDKGEGQKPAMAVDDMARLVRQAAQAGFRKAVITGGEPLAHPQRDALLDALAALRNEVKPLQIVLRTNLAYPLAGGRKATSQEGGHEAPPQEGGHEAPPQEGGHKAPSQEGGRKAPPREGGRKAPPQEGGRKAPPQEGGRKAPPQEGGRKAPPLLERLARSADQIVVSLDGDQVSHDMRRGAGTYARTVANLRDLIDLTPDPSPHYGRLCRKRRGEERRGEAVVIAATLTAAQTAGREGEAVRALGEELGVGVRFKPVLPLGRAAGRGLAPEFYSSVEDGCEAMIHRARPVSTCGLGMNLYVGPGGACYPCYALMGPRHALGNALDEGLAAVLARNDAYRRVTVDSNRRCRACALRYLCGGFCRAWSGADDPDAPLPDCAALRERARGLLLSALETLEASADQWLAAELPLL